MFGFLGFALRVTEGLTDDKTSVKTKECREMEVNVGIVTVCLQGGYENDMGRRCGGEVDIQLGYRAHGDALQCSG